VTRQVNGEDAARAGFVANAEDSLVGLNAQPSQGQAQSQSAFIGAALHEWQKYFLLETRWKPAAVVCDINQNTICGRVGT